MRYDRALWGEEKHEEIPGCGAVRLRLGQTLSYLQSTFNMNGVMGLLVLLACLGMLVTRGMTSLERTLLRWQ